MYTSLNCHFCFHWLPTWGPFFQCSGAGKTETSPSGSPLESQNIGHMVQSSSLSRKELRAEIFLPIMWHCVTRKEYGEKVSQIFDGAGFMIILDARASHPVSGFLTKGISPCIVEFVCPWGEEGSRASYCDILLMLLLSLVF